MRTYVLLLIFAFPPVLACGAAYARTSADFGKPVCSHYDDSAKQAARAAGVDQPTAATTPGTTSALVPVATTVAPSASAPTAAAKGGGTAGLTHPRTAPHWQTFLPGMFR